VIPPEGTTTIDDIGIALGVSGVGSADLTIDEGVLPDVVVDVVNDGGSQGMTGLSYAAIGTDRLLRNGLTGRLIAPSDPAHRRFNIGVRTVEASQIEMTVRSRDGHVVRVVDLQYPAGWFVQMSAADLLGVTLAGSESIEIAVMSGALIVYGTSIDDQSNDSTIQFSR
jgi:hypothetical protein